jgi:gluconolactonase
MRKKIYYSCVVLFAAILLTLNQTRLFSQSLLDPNAEVEEIVSGILQPEGPVWRDGLGLLFSDIRGNKIYKWTPEGDKEVYLDPSDNTNGLTYDLEGRFLAGQMGLRRIVRFEDNGTQISLADHYDGKKLNSPNDLVVKSDGSIFFTDPDFNIPGGWRNKELSFNGIYRISPKGELQLLTTSLALPNGICFSPDETKLYVNDSQVHKIYVWDVVDDSTIANKKLLYTIPVTGYAVGMKIDADGNIYCTCSSAVWVISPSGEQLGKIDLPPNASASNCAWGDADKKTLFITAGTSVYKIRPLLSAIEQHNSILPEKFNLFQNYPNPFNPTTKIEYSIPVFSHVSLKVYNSLGQAVAVLFEDHQQAGRYVAKFDALGLTSGVYVYRLQSGNVYFTKKFILLK